MRERELCSRERVAGGSGPSQGPELVRLAPVDLFDRAGASRKRGAGAAADAETTLEGTVERLVYSAETAPLLSRA